MMKKVLLLCLALIAFTSVCFASAPNPTKKIVLLYMVSDAVLQCQNADEDIIVGARELEEELVNHYSKRFIVQGVQRFIPDDSLSSDERLNSIFTKVKANQVPFIVGIKLEGQDQSSTLYQNAYGAQKIGVAPSVNIRLIEIMPDDSQHLYFNDYGIKSYSAGTFAVGMNIYAAQTDPRKNAKNAIRGCFRDACKFNEDINKYANPIAYENEYNRFTGNFKPLSLAQEKNNSTTNNKIEKFKAWCNADESRKLYLIPLSTFNNSSLMINYIDSLIQMGAYKE